MTTFLMVVQLLVCLGLITVVLLQDSSGEGLGAIGGGSKMFFNKASRTERFLEQATKWLAGAFMVLAVILSLI
ncbi:MAG: preprotein translocase subunit SecG [Firmicutes bacterium]|nr:preprotein translocase subunit SecG [Bacillota bacterium]